MMKTNLAKEFTPTTRRNPCILCGDTKGKCRETGSEIVLCMTFTDEWSASGIPGYKFIGLTKDGLWGKFAPVQDNWSETDRLQWQQQTAQLRQQRSAIEAQRRQAALPAVERDRLYQQLLSQLSLSPVDRADLHERGFTDAMIEAIGFRSVEQWQRLTFELPHTLSGVSLDGWSLNTQPGYLIPVRDVNGLITAMQVRLRETEEGRYRWLTSVTKKRPNGPSPHLPNGELPLAVYRPQRVREVAIALCEGTGAKPALLSHRLGLVTVGSAGGLFAASPQTLKTTLDQLSTELDSKTIRFFPDAGAVVNPHVLRQCRETWRLLRSWGYHIQIAWWGQIWDADQDIDELDEAGLKGIKLISVARLESIANPDILSLLKRYLPRNRRGMQGFGKRSPQSLTTETETAILSAATEPGTNAESQSGEGLGAIDSSSGTSQVAIANTTTGDILYYEPGERLECWDSLTAKYILDSSGTGGGKSYDAGLFLQERAEEGIYISNDNRNPTTNTVAQLTPIPARHDGLYRDEVGKVRRAKSQQNLVEESNCHRTAAIGALRSKAIQGADQDVACTTCPMLHECHNNRGDGFGFKFERLEALQREKLRSHPLSLPDPDEYDYRSMTLFVDEAGTVIKPYQNIEVTISDIDQLLAFLAVNAPELLMALRPILVGLRSLLNGKQPFHGYDYHAIVAALPPVPNDLDYRALIEVLRPDLSMLELDGIEEGELNKVKGDDRRLLSRVSRQLRDDSRLSSAEMAQTIEKEVIKQWLPQFLDILNSHPGYARINFKKLTLTLPDHRLRAIADNAAKVVFLDATVTREDLAMALGVAPDEVVEIQQRSPQVENLTITQVVGLGRLGQQRGKDLERRAKAVVEHYRAIDPHCAVIDFKKYEEDWAWFRDSRGINDLEAQGITRLVLVGTPCMNLGVLLSEYAILTETHPTQDDPGFKAFVDRKIQAEYQQAIGRLRAHRRPTEQLEVIILSDFELNVGMPVQQIMAEEVTLEAAGKSERLAIAIQGAVRRLQEMGERVTQSAIGRLIGKSQQHISRFRHLLKTLLQVSNREMSKSEPVELEGEEAVTVEGLTGVVESIGLMELGDRFWGIDDICFSKEFKPQYWESIWQRLSAVAQVGILEGAALVLSPELMEGVGVVL